MRNTACEQCCTEQSYSVHNTTRLSLPCFINQHFQFLPPLNYYTITFIVIMVYPKSQALPPSPSKLARMSSNNTSQQKNDDDTTIITSNISPLRIQYPQAQVATTQVVSLGDAAALSLIIGMIDNCNTMISMQTDAIKSMQEGYSESCALFIKKFDVLVSHVKNIDDRITAIEGETNANTKQITELEQAIDGTSDTLDIIQSLLGTTASRVSRIENLIIRSSSKKRKRVSM